MAITKEQAIDILDKFDFFEGQRAGRELWNDKPYEVQEEDIKTFSRDVAELKAYIADVVPKSEVEKWQDRCREWHSVAELKSTCIMELDEGLAKANAEIERLRGILLQFTDIVHKWGARNGIDTSEISLVPILQKEADGIFGKMEQEIETLKDNNEHLAVLLEEAKDEANRYKRYFFHHDYDEMIAEVLDKLDRFINSNCIEIKNERGIKGYVTSGVHFAIAEFKNKYTEGKMIENNFTDEQVIKALECCAKGGACTSCPLKDDYSPCSSSMAHLALSLINKQKTDLDLLKSTITHKEEEAYNKGYADAKTELERLQAEKDALIKNYAECMKDYASEIFAEIESLIDGKFSINHGVVLMSKEDFAELEKKYTGGDK